MSQLLVHGTWAVREIQFKPSRGSINSWNSR